MFRITRVLGAAVGILLLVLRTDIYVIGSSLTLNDATVADPAVSISYDAGNITVNSSIHISHDSTLLIGDTDVEAKLAANTEAIKENAAVALTSVLRAHTEMSIFFDNSMTIEDAQALVNNAPHFLEHNSTLFFRFTPGTYAWNTALNFIHFSGTGTIHVYGDESEHPEVAASYTNQGVHVTSLDNHALYFDNVTPTVFVKYLHLTATALSCCGSVIKMVWVREIDIHYCHLEGTDNTIGMRGLHGELNTYYHAKFNHFSDMGRALIFAGVGTSCKTVGGTQSGDSMYYAYRSYLNGIITRSDVPYLEGGYIINHNGWVYDTY